MTNTEQITKLYMAGVPVSEIKDIYGVTREAVYQRLRTLAGWKGIKRHLARYRASVRLTELQEKSEDIVSGWLSGVNIKDLAIEFHTTERNVSGIIRDITGSTKRNYKRDLQIVEEYKNGVTQVELAKKYHISQPCISRIIKTLI